MKTANGPLFISLSDSSWYRRIGRMNLQKINETQIHKTIVRESTETHNNSNLSDNTLD